MKLVLLALLTWAVSMPLHASELRIAAASDLRFVMPGIERAFVEEYPGTQTQVVYGSSGRFFAQISNGAPFDLYMSADIGYPARLAEEQPRTGEVIAYAEGQLALWQSGATKPTMDALQQARRIAIANPQHAPYGEKALAWLQQLPQWPQLKSKLVHAESAAQVAHFVRSGSADLGITALSLVMSEQLQAHGSYLAIAPAQGEATLQQGMVVTARGASNPVSQQFIDFMQTQRAQKLLTDAGFVVPDVGH
ncbi:molybdate ABC transporter substrate-binding protein [Aliidiomarina sp. Khilg15.8]